jgi:hypothetical protein
MAPVRQIYASERGCVCQTSRSTHLCVTLLELQRLTMLI